MIVLEKHAWAKVKHFLICSVLSPKWCLMFCLSRIAAIRAYKIGHSKSTKQFSAALSPINQKSFLTSCNVQQVMAGLRQDGFYFGLDLPPEIYNPIIDYANAAICYSEGDPSLGFSYLEKDKAEIRAGHAFAKGIFFNSSLQCPAIQKLMYEPKLWQIAREYLGAEPKLTGTRLWWSFALSGQVQTESPAGFHYDLDDYQAVRFFFYLTDVDRGNGPHVALRGSHLRKMLKHQYSFTREYSGHELISYYGPENMVTFLGKAGQGFVEDPFCFHGVIPPVEHDRLMIQIQFARHDYGVHNDLISLARLTAR